MEFSRKGANLNGHPPANDEGGVVFPAQAAGVHVRPQTDVVPQHIGDPLFCTDIIDFNSLKQTSKPAFPHLILYLFIYYFGGVRRRLMTHHIVGPGDEVCSPLDVSDRTLAFMENGHLPSIQPVSFIQEQL